MVILPGLTGIVGPNGCGKSNLVEALRWVMGESSAKRLRGGEMDDVIFAGAAGRPPRNQAEVTVRLANPDFDAPVLFNDATTLEVTRKVLRGQGSAYRVNGRDHRAQDLKLLFADLASGAGSNAMVAQGRVAAIVNARPLDRRALLEEAAGITGLYSRRREAENRLRAAEQNLARVSDVRESKQSQRRNLDRQAGAARRYRELQDQRRGLAAVLMYLNWQETKAALNAANSKLSSLEADCERRELTEARAKREEDAANAALEPLRSTYAEAAARVQRLQLALDALDGEERDLGLKQESLTRQLTECGSDLEREQEQARAAHERLQYLEAEEVALKAQKAAAGPKITDAQSALAREETAERAATERLRDQAAQLSTARNERHALDARIDGLEGRAQALAARQRAGDQVQPFTGLSAEEIDARISTQAADQARLSALHGQLEAQQAEIAEARAALAAARQARQALAQQRAEGRAEAQGLAALLSTPVVRGSADKAPDLSHTGPPATLDQILTVAAGFAPQVAAALGAGMAAVVAPPGAAADVATAPTGGNYWRPHAPPSAPDLPAGALSLATAVSAPAWLSAVLAYVGQVESAEVALSLQAQLRAGQALTTAEGGLWRWDGLVIAADQSAGQAALLIRKQRLAVLRDTLRDLEPQIEAARATETKAQQALDQQTQGVMDAEVQVRESQRALAQAGQDIAAAQKTLADYRAKAAAQEVEQAGTRRERETVEVELGDLRQTRAKLAGLDTLEAQARQTQAEVEAAQATVRARRDELEQAKRDLIAVEARQATILTETFTFEGQYNKAATQVEVLRARASALETEATALATRPAQLEVQRADLSEKLAEARDAQALAGDALAAGEHKMRGLRASAQGALQALASAREARARCQGEQAAAQDRSADMARRAYEQFKRPAADLLALGPYAPGDSLPTQAAAQDRVTRLERQIDQIGTVNLMAETELTQIETELADMDHELDDLTKAISKLRGAITEINQEGRVRLKTAFDQVEVHFSALFQRLFGGGKARLELVGSSDPLEAGLEIIASPPGKRLQSLTLLSGGEQTLTALALIFAMFRANPAPLCVLDEVDAPLDDANVDRMCDLLGHIAREVGTRFLIVTHNALTMARVDRLFGVTMAERGVSRLVSVNLAEASSFGS